MLDEEFFHHYEPFTEEINPGPKSRDFSGFLIDINDNGVLEHVIVNDDIPDFTSISVYDLRLNPTQNPVIHFVINGVN